MRYSQLLATLLPLIAASVCEAQTAPSSFDAAKIDKWVVAEFQKAWHISANGTCDIEGVVLLFANADGSYRAQTLRQTNERRQVTFKWNPHTTAIVHTHPNDARAQPTEQDIQVAERFKVPMFTITRKGMFMYDPGTKKITKIKDGLSWLEASSWKPVEYVATGKPPIKTERQENDHDQK